MQAVILAAGQSSRFYPLSNGKHKSMVLLCGKPILEYTIDGLKESGIKEIILVQDSTGLIQSYFGNGEKFGISIKYITQPQPLGAGNGLLLTKDYIKGDFLLLNGSHVDIKYFAKKLVDAKTEKDDAVLIAREKDDTWNNGVAKVDGDRLEDLIEKPEKGKEPSKLCIIGIYLFTKKFLTALESTPSEHYQLEKAISNFAKNNFVKLIKTDQDVVTLKYPWDIISLKNYLFKTLKKSTGKSIKIAQSAEIIGEVVIEDGAVVEEGAKIKGPCYIGENAYIGNHAVLRNGADIGENVVIGAYMEIKNSVVMESTKVHSGFIGDSVIGKNVRIGAQFCTANVRLDRSSVKSFISGKPVDTGVKSLGFIAGDNVKIGVKCSTMPGVIIGENAIIGPSTVVSKNVDANSKYYSKFQEVIVKHE